MVCTRDFGGHSEGGADGQADSGLSSRSKKNSYSQSSVPQRKQKRYRCLQSRGGYRRCFVAPDFAHLGQEGLNLEFLLKVVNDLELRADYAAVVANQHEPQHAYDHHSERQTGKQNLRKLVWVRHRESDAAKRRCVKRQKEAAGVASGCAHDIGLLNKKLIERKTLTCREFAQCWPP